jgi:hypothetical protein
MPGIVIAHRYTRPTVRPLSTLPSAHGAKRCGHARHVGTCPACQRAVLEHAARQLAEATIARQARQARTH